jgi:ATP-dependent Clp protease ATP-binding subunit ClpC
MYERFTDRARKVLDLAQQEARRLDHEYMGTEHLLLGLIREGSGVAANVLRNLDVSVCQAEKLVRKIIQPGPDSVRPDQRIPQSPRCKKALEHAIKEAELLGHRHVGTEHLLLGLLREGEGIAAQVLITCGCQLEEVRQETLALLGVRAKRPSTVACLTVDDLSPAQQRELLELLLVYQPSMVAAECAFDAPMDLWAALADWFSKYTR